MLKLSKVEAKLRSSSPLALQSNIKAMSSSTCTHIGMLYDQSRPPKPTFSIDDIPDLVGKVVIVTGGNAGVGRETVYALLRKNTKVYMASRNRSRAEPAIADLKEKTGKRGNIPSVGSSEPSIGQRAAEEFQRYIHILTLLTYPALMFSKSRVATSYIV